MAEHPLTPLVRAGLAWLTVEQPDDALADHLGEYLGRFTVGEDEHAASMCPRGARGRVVVVVNRTERYAEGHQPGDDDLLNGYTEADVTALRDAVTAAGGNVTDEWNGAPAVTVSFAVDAPVHRSLLAALDRYHAGCPEHRSVFCGWDGCPWWRDGYARAVRPEVAR